MKTIILVRHGESETNLSGVFTGQLNAGLTQMGKEQARLMAKAVSDYKTDKIYTSSLIRAVQTAEAISDVQKCELIKTDSFCEINAGKWQGKTFNEISEIYPETYKVWRENIALAHPDGGESCKGLYKRVVSKFEEILGDNSDEVVCIVSHATPIRMIESYIHGKSIEKAQELSWVPNASISIYRYNGGFETIKRGYCDYLGDKITNLPKNI